jgi:superfamily II DNA or RNA helicase/HKD family nuclease
MGNLKEGLYDQLVTRGIRKSINEQEANNLKSVLATLEENDSPDYLARHVIRQIKLSLRGLRSEDRKLRQIELANSILDFLKTEEDSGNEELIDPPGEVLRAIYKGSEPPKSPSTPLGASSLIMNALDEPRLGFELEREMASANQVLMIVSFIQWRGWQRLKKSFQELAERQVPVHILTTTYIGATDFRAIHEIAQFSNVDLRISLDGRRRRLHAKAWLFQRDNGFSSIYVGSANLSGPALEDGIEWTVKLSEVEAPHIVQRFQGAFDSLWCDDEFERFRPEDEELCSRVKNSLEVAGLGSNRRDTFLPVFFDLRPHPYQQAILDQLESERTDRGHFRNLIVAPTGTGKTLVAAFDYKRQAFSGNRPKLLFLAHREELLSQALSRFRHVLRDESFGEMLFGGEDPEAFNYLFATIQSFRSKKLLELYGADYWEYVVLDEAHHVPAQGYREIIASLRPRILVGLTATPERMDGESILPWFDHRIADEMRLWHAIERQYLVPFDYFGIYDGTDLSNLSWKRGRYAFGELEEQYIGNNRRANLIIDQFCQIYGDQRQSRALGFCVSISHAEYMAEMFRNAGIPAEAITSQTEDDNRTHATAKLRNREVNVLFTVDLFNEGVDIPEVDCVLFLRPTESSTVFLQQLGRGLRLDTGKTNCLVLDFIGNQRREFRFDQRFRALLGGGRQQLAREIETGITRLPGNCYFRLDKQSRKVILDNLRGQLNAGRARMVAELKDLSNSSQRRPTLVEYLSETGYELNDIYKPSAGGWHALLLEAGLLPGISAEDISFARNFHQLIHVDSRKRLQFYLRIVSEESLSDENLPVIEQRMIHMLAFRLLSVDERTLNGTSNVVLERLRGNPAVKEEFVELCRALVEKIKLHSDEKPLIIDSPLFLHRQYERDEVFVAFGKSELVGSWQSQTGRVWLEDKNAEILFVTLDKSDKTFSPSTRYEDYAISQTRFHWQSQSTTSEQSKTGRRYIEQKDNGASFLLFVRGRKKEPFVFLGPARYSSHKDSRPMNIIWNLEHPIPAHFYENYASLLSA